MGDRGAAEALGEQRTGTDPRFQDRPALVDQEVADVGPAPLIGVGCTGEVDGRAGDVRLAGQRGARDRLDGPAVGVAADVLHARIGPGGVAAQHPVDDPDPLGHGLPVESVQDAQAGDGARDGVPGLEVGRERAADVRAGDTAERLLPARRARDDARQPAGAPGEFAQQQ